MTTFNMKKTLIILALNSLFIGLSAQGTSSVLITENQSGVIKPDASAILHVSSNSKGFLFPRVALTSNKDIITVPNPIDGVTVYNTTIGKFNYWFNKQWNKSYEAEDALSILPITTNYVGSSSDTTISSTFPSTMPLFTLNSNTNGWTYLGVTTTTTNTNPNNTNYIICEGMTGINNDIQSTDYQFAIGVFIDKKLKLVKKYYNEKGTNACSWKKFNLSGVVFENLPVGNHVVEVYGYNLPKKNPNSTIYTQIAYGGTTSVCDNLNTFPAKIFLTVQVTEIKQ